MYNLSYRIKQCIIVALLTFIFPISGFCSYSNFLPMEDSMSAARNASVLPSENIKPYRQSFNLGETPKKKFFEFTTSDISAFILLAGIYVMLVRKNSKARNASF